MGKWENKLGRALRRLLAFLSGLWEDKREEHGNAHEETGDAPEAKPKPTTPAPDTGDDEVPFSELKWKWGGADGSRAVREPACAIRNLKVHDGRMSYSWQRGGCENLGAANASDANCLACFFCLLDGKWTGGKFEWISTSRRTRSLGNVRGGYGGWRTDACDAAGKFAFCIVSGDRRKRSNVIVCEKGK